MEVETWSYWSTSGFRSTPKFNHF